MAATKFIITQATVKDGAILTDLSVNTFRDAFGPTNRKEDMDKYLAEEMNLMKLTKELEDNDNHFVLAWLDDVAIGYAKMRGNREQGMENNNPLELERIYVLQACLDKKVGAALMRYCIDYAASNNHDVIWLGVWEQNHRAVNFCKRWGFEFFGSHPFILGDDVQTDVLMRKEL